MKTYLKLKEIFNEASLTSDIAGILHWDMATMMPSSSRDQRSDQLAYLSKLSHSKISSSEVGDLIEDSKNLNLNNSDQKNLNEMDREHKLASAIPTELVEKISKSSAKCEGVWQEAREKSEFNLVKKDLETDESNKVSLPKYISLKNHKDNSKYYLDHKYIRNTFFLFYFYHLYYQN